MPELRGALIGLGLLFLAGLMLWEWRRSKRRYAPQIRIESAVVIEPVERARRMEPSMDGMSGLSIADPDESLEVPTIHPVEPVLVGVVAESAVDVPAAARFEVTPEPGFVPAPAISSTDVPIQWPPKNAERVVSLRVVNPKGEPLSGRMLRIALEAAGMRFGPQMIYHRVNAEGAVLVSAANMLRPGNLDPELMDTQVFRGVNVFSVLPGALSSVRMLDELVTVARGLAQRLSAIVQDEQGAELDAPRLAGLRATMPEIAKSAGDGLAP